MFGRLTPIRSRKESKHSPDISNDYGGIYVGDTTRQGSTVPNRLEQFEELGHNTSQEMKLPRGNSTCITVSNSFGNENKMATIDGSASSTHISSVKHGLNSTSVTNDEASFNDHMCILPNQVPNEDKIITTRPQVHSDNCSSHVVHVAQYNSTNVVVSNDLHITKTEVQTPADIINPLDDTEINNIEAFGESSAVDNAVDPNTDDILPEYFQKNTESSSVTSSCKDSNALYRDSKEHNSLVKASIANIVILILLIVLVIIIKIVGPVNGDNVSSVTYVAIIVLIKLYRTFSPLLMAIYCFEVVNLLFNQTVISVKDNIQTLCNAVYNIF